MNIYFKPESEEFKDATFKYENIWSEYGNRIISAFKEATGLDFIHTEINVVVYEGVSFSGKKDTPMKLRASYDSDVKLATLIHELGHKLLVQVKEYPEGFDEHRVLFLFLYDVWVKVKDEEFADRMVEVEKKRKGIYDYESAWEFALSKDYSERQRMSKSIIS